MINVLNIHKPVIIQQYSHVVYLCLQIIHVDWVHVESRANDIAKSDKNIQLVLGQLIDEYVFMKTNYSDVMNKNV